MLYKTEITNHLFNTLRKEGIMRQSGDSHYKCCCGSRIKKASIFGHLNSSKHSRFIFERSEDKSRPEVCAENIVVCPGERTSECAICYSDQPVRLFHRCSKCRHKICIKCAHRIEQYGSIKCPFCRHKGPVHLPSLTQASMKAEYDKLLHDMYNLTLEVIETKDRCLETMCHSQMNLLTFMLKNHKALILIQHTGHEKFFPEFYISALQNSGREAMLRKINNTYKSIMPRLLKGLHE